MTTNLTPKLQDQINKEADTLTAGFQNNNYYESGIIQGYKEGYEDASNKYALKWQEAEQRADRYEKALKDIRRWELATGKKVRVKYLDILKDIMRVVNNALTPKQSTNGK